VLLRVSVRQKRLQIRVLRHRRRMTLLCQAVKADISVLGLAARQIVPEALLARPNMTEPDY